VNSFESNNSEDFAFKSARRLLRCSQFNVDGLIANIISIAALLIFACWTCSARSQPIKLNSFTIESSHPTTVAKWKSKKTEIGGTLIYPEVKSDKYPVILYLLS